MRDSQSVPNVRLAYTGGDGHGKGRPLANATGSRPTRDAAPGINEFGPFKAGQEHQYELQESTCLIGAGSS